MIKVELSKYIDEQLIDVSEEIYKLKLSLCDSSIEELIRIKYLINGMEGKRFILDRLSRMLKNNYFEEEMKRDKE